jgi:hypothetical protein
MLNLWVTGSVDSHHSARIHLKSGLTPFEIRSEAAYFLLSHDQVFSWRSSEEQLSV